MSYSPSHNPKLPSPEEVLLVEPSNILFDGVEYLGLDKTEAFWTPGERHTVGMPGTIVSPAFGAEVFNQVAGYVAAHGLNEKKMPVLAGADVRWRRIIMPGELVNIELVTSALAGNIYKAEGVIKKAGDVACRGVIYGSLNESGDLGSVHFPQEANTPAYERPASERQKVKEASETDIIPADLKVLDNGLIEIDGKIIRLSPTSIYILDYLIRNRDRFVTAGEVFNQPDFPSGATASSRQPLFSQSKNHLKRILVSKDGYSLITQKQNNTTRRQYLRLNEGIRITS